RVNGKVDVLWVGLGCPKQEKWMLAHQHLRVGVMLGVGAAFDFNTERIARAALDAALRARMGVPARAGSEAAVAALPGLQLAVSVFLPEPAGSPAAL